jgi:hypothetical protein
MKTKKLLKPNKLTLAVRAAMSPQGLTGAALGVAGSLQDAYNRSRVAGKA